MENKDIEQQYGGIKLVFDHPPLANSNELEFSFSSHELLTMVLQSFQVIYEMVMPKLDFTGPPPYPMKAGCPTEWLDMAQLPKQLNKQLTDKTQKPQNLITDVGGRKICIKVPSDRYSSDMGDLPLYVVLHDKRTRESVIVSGDVTDRDILENHETFGKEPLNNQQQRARISYPDFFGLIRQHYGDNFDDAVVIKECRRILSGDRLQPHHARVLPVMLSTLFCSEVSRNRVCIVTGIMLFDLIEARVPSPPGIIGDCFNLNNALWHPELYDLPKKANKLPENISKSKLGGLFPMAHLGSWSEEFNEEGPFQQNRELTMAHIKSIIILIEWLLQLDAHIHPGFKITKLTKNEAPKKTNSHTNLLILSTFLRPIINQRLSHFGCMLSLPQVNNDHVAIDLGYEQQLLNLHALATIKLQEAVKRHDEQLEIYLEKIRQIPEISSEQVTTIGNINGSEDCSNYLNSCGCVVELTDIAYFQKGLDIHYRDIAKFFSILHLLEAPYQPKLMSLILNEGSSYKLLITRLLLRIPLLREKILSEYKGIYSLLSNISSQYPLRSDIAGTLLDPENALILDAIDAKDLLLIIKDSRTLFELLIINHPDVFKKLMTVMPRYQICEYITQMIRDADSSQISQIGNKIISHHYSEHIDQVTTSIMNSPPQKKNFHFVNSYVYSDGEDSNSNSGEEDSEEESVASGMNASFSY